MTLYIKYDNNYSGYFITIIPHKIMYSLQIVLI